MKRVHYTFFMVLFSCGLLVNEGAAKSPLMSNKDQGKSCLMPTILSKELDSIRQKSKDALILIEDSSQYISNEALLQELSKQGISRQQALKILNQAVNDARRQDPMLAENPKNVVEQKILRAALASLQFHGYTSYVMPLLADFSEYGLPRNQLMKNGQFVAALSKGFSEDYSPLNREFTKMICQKEESGTSLLIVPKTLAQDATCLSGEVSANCNRTDFSENVPMIKYSFNGLRALAGWGADMIAKQSI